VCNSKLFLKMVYKFVSILKIRDTHNMYREIPVYKAEAEDGISEAIQAKENRSVAAYCPILTDKDVISSAAVEKTKIQDIDSFNRSVASNQDQFDLEYIYSILATTGWNRNDDVFDSYETWSARNTAEDKPFNKGHDPNNIIGHITGNAVVDENYELVTEESEIDSLPDKFHILTSAVVYKHISSRDEKLSLATKALLQEILEGKWFVSMEALFSNFDYALMDAQGEQKIVSRNEDTAFLSKHLRSYGGAGEYEGSRVGRLMRNLTFSGKGLVENPGNPESIIFKQEDNVIFRGVATSQPNFNALVTSSKGESSMSDNNEQVQTLKAQVEKLESRLKALDEEKVKAQISEFEAACAGKDAEISELILKLESANEAGEVSNKTLEELVAAKAESDKIVAELTEKLEAIQAESIKTSRISALVDKGVEKTAAESLVETFAGITDEQFEALIQHFTEAPHWPGHKPDDEKKKKNDEEDKKAEAPAGGRPYKKMADKKDAKAELEKSVEAAEEAVDAEALDNAEVDEEVAALAATNEDESEQIVASLNQYFSEVLSGTGNKKES